VATENQIKSIHNRLRKLEKNASPMANPPTQNAQQRENWIKRNAYLVSVLTLLLGGGIGTSLLTLFKNTIIDERIHVTLHEPLQKIIDNGDKMAEIDGKVSNMIEMLKIVIQNETKNTSTLPLNEFQKHLSAISTILTAAKSEKGSAIIGASEADTIRQKLIDSNQGAPEYWKAVAAMINYRSPASNWSLPRCAEQFAHALPTLQMAAAENCQIQLDSSDAALFYAIMHRYSWSFMFQNCLISYKGGPIPTDLIKKVLFVNCRFDIDVPSNSEPTRFGKTVLSALLSANDVNHVEVLVSHS
jgi:hypothetical protein